MSRQNCGGNVGKTINIMVETCKGLEQQVCFKSGVNNRGMVVMDNKSCEPAKNELNV